MKKSPLQLRAERAAELFTNEYRKPIVIEFAGVPKAGKSSTISQVQAFLKRCGFRIEVVVERASVCPIRDKKHFNFNVWTACTTLTQVLEKTQITSRGDDPQILILDRGLFDAICWMTLMERLARIRHADRELIEKFLLIEDWSKRISSVILMLTSPDDALKRERGFLPVVNATGSIMNKEVLQKNRDTILECAEKFKNQFRIYKIDTSAGETKDNPPRTAEVAVDIILSQIEEQIKEEILVLPRNLIQDLFRGKSYLPAAEAAKLVRLFHGKGTYLPREEAENNRDMIQALPLAIIRNASGAILRLRRREKAQDNPLHEKVVIWAGGHVRREDATNGDPLIHCAIRELDEELRLNIERKDLTLIGAIYSDIGERTYKHVAIAYEWRAKSDDVAVALSSAEFFERRGNSVSGSFSDLPSLLKDVEDKKINEPWSEELVRHCITDSSSKLSPRLPF